MKLILVGRRGEGIHLVWSEGVMLLEKENVGPVWESHRRKLCDKSDKEEHVRKK
jgi:hypothetical protein